MDCKLTAVFLKLVQCQPQLDCKIQPFVVEGPISLILKPFLRVFFSFQHFKRSSIIPKPPKEGLNQVPLKWTSTIAIFKSLQSGIPMDLINNPISRVSCLNVGIFSIYVPVGISNTDTQPDGTVFFLISTYLRGRSH